MSQHHPTRIYRGLRRRLAHVLFLANGECWLRECRLEGSRKFSRQPYEHKRQERHEAFDDIERMLRGLERAGALTRAGAHMIVSLFACAIYAGVNPLSLRGETFMRLLKWAWTVERLWYPVCRWIHGSTS